MAPPAGTLRVGRYFLALLALVAVLYVIVAFGSRHTPKLGLDLVGGAQVTFTAKTPNGSVPSSSSMQQAKQIITERVNGSGVSGADVVVQGNDQIVVSVPGGTKADIAKLGAAAVLNFRGMVAPAVPQQCNTGKQGAGSAPSTGSSPSAAPASQSAVSSSAPASGAAESMHPLAAPATGRTHASSGAAHPSSTPTRSAAGTASGGPTSSASASPHAPSAGAPSASAPSASASSSAQSVPTCSLTSVADAAKQHKFTVPLSDTAYESMDPTAKAALTQALQSFDCANASSEKDRPNTYFVACDGSGYVHLLGPVIVAGKQISTASAVAPNTQQPEWTVQLNLKGSGQSAWADWTTKHNINSNTATGQDFTNCSSTTTPCADFVCFTLDGAAISCPVTENAINGGATQISGSFTANSAQTLANQLKYGALPLSFRADQAQTVSATLGTSQLKAGLLAGGIGLVLVVLYSLFYYRALGLVTIASLLVSGLLTYGMLVLLGTQIGFTLSLAGIAGFIVAVGITADSFVVFFERLKDEVHEGRSVRVAVPRAWVRARRTILSADTVSFLAAAILYYFAAGDVRGFAFTLGLSTILDLVVVFLFTHPMVSLLSRSRAFGSARFTGLDALRGAPLPEPAGAARPAGSTTGSGRATARGDDVPTRPGDARSATAVLDEPAGAPGQPAADGAGRARPALGGTAAERAAARRARLRENPAGGQPGQQPGRRPAQSDEEGER